MRFFNRDRIAVGESQDCSWAARGWARSLLFVAFSYASNAALNMDWKLDEEEAMVTREIGTVGRSPLGRYGKSRTSAVSESHAYGTLTLCSCSERLKRKVLPVIESLQSRVHSCMLSLQVKNLYILSTRPTGKPDQAPLPELIFKTKKTGN